MKNKSKYQHPLLLNKQIIKEKGIVVFDDARGLPLVDEAFVSPDYVICIGTRGHVEITYDGTPDYSKKGTVAVIFPNHKLHQVSKSPDYRATLIAVDASMLSDPMLRIVEQMRYRLEPYPRVELDRHEYNVIMQLVGVMRETLLIDLPDQRLYLMRQLEYLMRLLSYYRTIKLNEQHAVKRISVQFHNDLTKYSADHHDVAFYADKACLSPKHFSSVIKRETGHTASWWIHSQIIKNAEIVLISRQDLSIQAIADILGFPDQATFSRYFKRETGFYPTEYRTVMDRSKHT